MTSVKFKESFANYLRRFLPVRRLKIPRPILRSNPPLVVGILVLRATLVLRPEMPMARFKEKDKPRNNDILVILYNNFVYRIYTSFISYKIGICVYDFRIAVRKGYLRTIPTES